MAPAMAGATAIYHMLGTMSSGGGVAAAAGDAEQKGGESLLRGSMPS